MTEGAKMSCELCRKKCTVKSKGAALVLLLVLLGTAAVRTQYQLLTTSYQGSLQHISESFLFVTTGVFLLVVAIFFGWLADAKLGHYRVVKIGINISWLASILVSVISLIKFNIILDQNSVAWIAPLITINLFYWMGVIICGANVFQLSLEQIPDASADDIISLISWFAISVGTGYWIGDVIGVLPFACRVEETEHKVLNQVLTLFPVIFESVIFILFHLISPKWLIIEPKSPQYLKNVYRVLKFAAKHKTPFSYWQERMPSRLDLGKSRYGGPFTADQVEDVKTFFRILAVGLGIFPTVFASSIHEYNKDWAAELNVSTIFFNISQCSGSGILLATVNPGFCAVITVLVYEFLIYPCLNYRLPSTVKKFGISSCLAMVQNLSFLVVSILTYFNIVQQIPWMIGIGSVLYGFLAALMLTPTLEFICAQAPYNVKGLVSGYMQLVFWLALTLGQVFVDKFLQSCAGPSCSLAITSVGAVSSVLAFLLYLIIAHWYKTRKRGDDEVSPHQRVGNVYNQCIPSV